jgi:hypothetical protein
MIACYIDDGKEGFLTLLSGKLARQMTAIASSQGVGEYRTDICMPRAALLRYSILPFYYLEVHLTFAAGIYNGHWDALFLPKTAFLNSKLRCT